MTKPPGGPPLPRWGPPAFFAQQQSAINDQQRFAINNARDQQQYEQRSKTIRTSHPIPSSHERNRKYRKPAHRQTTGDSTVQCELVQDHRLYLELRTEPELTAPAVIRLDVTSDASDLVVEAYDRLVLAGKLAGDEPQISAKIEPKWLDAEPAVDSLEVVLNAGDGSHERVKCESGKWVRRALEIAQELRAEGSISEEQTCYRSLIAERGDTPVDVRPPMLQPPVAADMTLEEAGVMKLGEGSLMHDRPVLVNRRYEEEILQRTKEAEMNETGGATLGKIIRLPEPLPGTQTRIVTVLMASVCDGRHTGDSTTFNFSPDALAEAAQIAAISGRSVLNCWHTHGWGCGECNQKETCGLAQATFVSPSDYQVAENLFPAKSSLMPIAGRKAGAAGTEPVLVIHGWRGGMLRPLRWQRYED